MTFSQFQEQFHISLDPQQSAAVQAVEGPVLLLAVPGSGKTTALVTRIGYLCYALGVLPEQILTMTYTVSAARDMRQRFMTVFGREEPLAFYTINGVCSRIIRLYERMMGRQAFELLSDAGRQSALVAEIARHQSGEFANEGTVKAIQTAIAYVKNQMLRDEEIQEVEVEGVDFPPIYRAYCETLRREKWMDYDDQMVYARQILLRYPELLNRLRAQYRYICVDEAQDTSKIQHAVIELLAGKGGNLFMVGDEDQSIYGFRAAYPQALLDFERTYGGRVLYLERNYRSTRQIVEAADRFIQKNQQRRPKHMTAVRGAGPDLETISVYNRQEQYALLARMGTQCREETAILYRDNDSALPLIDLLDREGIPYRCRQMDGTFFTHRTIRDLTDTIRLAQQPRDGERFLRVYYKLGAGISRAAAEEAVRLAGPEEPLLAYIAGMETVSPWTARQCRALLTHMQGLLRESGDRAIYRIVHFMGYGDYLEERKMDAGRAEILEALGTREATPLALLERLEVLEQVVRAGAEAPESPLILSTIHSSKGLEYRHVILMDVADGIFPRAVPGKDATPEEQAAWEEERRLFYVGMTRAKDRLSLVRFRKAELPSVFAQEVLGPVTLPRVVKRILRPCPKPAAPASRSVEREAEGYQPGVPVRHRRFGRGQVVQRNGDVIVVSFQDGGRWKLSLTAALRAGQLQIE